MSKCDKVTPAQLAALSSALSLASSVISFKLSLDELDAENNERIDIKNKIQELQCELDKLKDEL